MGTFWKCFLLIPLFLDSLIFCEPAADSVDQIFILFLFFFHYLGFLTVASGEKIPDAVGESLITIILTIRCKGMILQDENSQG